MIQGAEMDGILDFTDTSDSDSYHDRIFLTQVPFVFELHDITKDNPKSTESSSPTPVKIRKQRRKKKEPANKTESCSSLSSGNVSDASSVAPPPEAKEEFYDAHESYYGIPRNQIPVTAAAAVLNTHSITPSIKAAQDLKTAPPAPSQQITTTTAPTDKIKEPSPLIKPSLPPE